MFIFKETVMCVFKRHSFKTSYKFISWDGHSTSLLNLFKTLNTLSVVVNWASDISAFSANTLEL